MANCPMCDAGIPTKKVRLVRHKDGYVMTKIEKRKLVVTTDDEADAYYLKADAWFEEHGRRHFNHARFVARMAVAEYMANQDGKTVYDHNPFEDSEEGAHD